MAYNGSRLSEVAGDPLAGRQTFWITAVRRCREATEQELEGTAAHSAKEEFAAANDESEQSERFCRTSGI